MDDRPSLEIAVAYTVLSGACFVVAAYLGDGWLMLVLAIVGFATVFAATICWGDVITYKVSIRIRDMRGALTYGQVQLAYALKGLTQVQTDMVERESGISIYRIPGDVPAEYIRCIGGDVPRLFAADFFWEASQLDRGHLPPVRDGNKIGGGDGWVAGVKFATLLTNTIVHFGWADDARGTHAAVLTEPLDRVAARFGVEI